MIRRLAMVAGSKTVEEEEAMLRQSLITVIGALLVACGGAVNAADPAIAVISHEVADVGEWKKRFDATREARKKAGATERFVMRDANKPNTVIVVLEFDSVQSATKYVSDAGFKQRIKKASATGTAEIKVGTTNFGGK